MSFRAVLQVAMSVLPVTKQCLLCDTDIVSLLDVAIATLARFSNKIQKADEEKVKMGEELAWGLCDLHSAVLLHAALCELSVYSVILAQSTLTAHNNLIADGVSRAYVLRQLCSKNF